MQRELINVEGFDRKEKMLQERREWILLEKEKFVGVKKDPIPANIDGFYMKDSEDEEEEYEIVAG